MQLAETFFKNIEKLKYILSLKVNNNKTKAMWLSKLCNCTKEFVIKWSSNVYILDRIYFKDNDEPFHDKKINFALSTKNVNRKYP